MMHTKIEPQDTAEVSTRRNVGSVQTWRQYVHVFLLDRLVIQELREVNKRILRRILIIATGSARLRVFPAS
jgi:hypothetical protein